MTTYSPDFPARFDSQEAAEGFCRNYFWGYNEEYHDTGIALLTPSQVHYGEAPTVLAQRQTILDAVFARTPQRFGSGHPQVPSLPQVVYINRPAQPISGQGTP